MVVLRAPAAVVDLVGVSYHAHDLRRVPDAAPQTVAVVAAFRHPQALVRLVDLFGRRRRFPLDLARCLRLRRAVDDGPDERFVRVGQRVPAMINIFYLFYDPRLGTTSQKAFMAHSGWYHVTLGLWPWRSDLGGNQMLRRVVLLDGVAMAVHHHFVLISTQVATAAASRAVVLRFSEAPCTSAVDTSRAHRRRPPPRTCSLQHYRRTSRPSSRAGAAAQKRLGLRGFLLRPVFRLEVGLRGRGLARGRLGGRRGRLARLGAHHWRRAPFGCPARGAGRGAGRDFLGLWGLRGARLRWRGAAGGRARTCARGYMEVLWRSTARGVLSDGLVWGLCFLGCFRARGRARRRPLMQVSLGCFVDGHSNGNPRRVPRGGRGTRAVRLPPFLRSGCLPSVLRRPRAWATLANCLLVVQLTAVPQRSCRADRGNDALSPKDKTGSSRVRRSERSLQDQNAGVQSRRTLSPARSAAGPSDAAAPLLRRRSVACRAANDDDAAQPAFGAERRRRRPAPNLASVQRNVDEKPPLDDDRPPTGAVLESPGGGRARTLRVDARKDRPPRLKDLTNWAGFMFRANAMGLTEQVEGRRSVKDR